MFIVIAHPPPPPPPAIIKNCDYQIEVNDTGSRTYKCISEKEYNDILTQRAEDSKKFDESINWLFTRWQLYVGVFVVFLLWIFWPRKHDYYPFERF